MLEVIDHLGNLVHVFCIAKHSGRNVYIDVRGATTDILECLAEFPILSQDDYSIRRRDIEADMRLEDKGDIEGLIFAKYLVEKDIDFYDVSKFPIFDIKLRGKIVSK